MAQLEFHPLCELLPKYSDAEYRLLVEDIKAKGLIHPIVLFDGQIIDGRHRYLACMDAGVQPVTTEYQGNDLIGYIESACLHRDMTKSQRAMLAVALLDYERDQAKKRMSEMGAVGGKSKGVEKIPPPSIDQSKSRDQAGKRLGVSGRYVSDAEKIIQTGSVELIESVKNGKITVNEAAPIAKLNTTAQRKIISIENPQQRKDELMKAKARSEACKRRDNPIQSEEKQGTSFLRKWLSSVERMAMFMAQDGVTTPVEIADKIEQDMDWDHIAIVAQFDRCRCVIEAMHIIHARNIGKRQYINAVK